jgi:predicted GNAT family acetyltransferase
METIGETTVDGQPHPVVRNDQAGRFEIRVADDVAVLAFHVRGTVLSLNHTEVPVSLRGKGLADVLAQTALEYARRQGMTVNPYCSFVAAYIQRHPEYRPLIDEHFRA